MQNTSWYPRSTRNRIAMVMCLLSLILLITWNLLPTPFDPAITNSNKGLSIVAVDYWQEVFRTFYYFKDYVSDRIGLIILIHNFTMLILAIFTLLALPAKRLWQAFSPLRYIAALLLLSSCTFWCNLLIEYPNSHYFILSILVTLNFLLTATSLLLFKNETTDTSYHGISST